jgi:hypothetical protein
MVGILAIYQDGDKTGSLEILDTPKVRIERLSTTHFLWKIRK